MEHSSLRQIQKLFKKTLYSPKIPLSIIREEYDTFFYKAHIPNNTDIVHCTVKAIPVEILKPEVAAANRVLLYVHGGFFLSGSCKASRNICASLTHECDCKLFLPEYRLAPEYPFPAGLEDLFTVYIAMLKEYKIPSSSIIFAGDGSGAGLAVALVHYLKQKKLPLPAALALISPWLDVSCTNEEMIALRKQDKFLIRESLQAAAQRYTASENFKNPLVSPIYGSFTDFPPTFIQCGSKEILLADAKLLKRKIDQAGGIAELDVRADMWHFFQSMDAQSKEAHLAVEAIGKWVQALFKEEH